LTTAVRDGVTGCLVDPAGGAEDYADALEQVLTDSALYARLSAAARERYETELNWPSACRSAVATILE
jgi:glycosyltransferase involved in cell wall biosynthesis